jgi:hypothetical protein
MLLLSVSIYLYRQKYIIIYLMTQRRRRGPTYAWSRASFFQPVHFAEKTWLKILFVDLLWEKNSVSIKKISWKVWIRRQTNMIFVSSSRTNVGQEHPRRLNWATDMLEGSSGLVSWDRGWQIEWTGEGGNVAECESSKWCWGIRVMVRFKS